jgi:hypothetical protein
MMNVPSSRNFTRLAAAIIIAAVVVLASILLYSSRVVTVTTTRTITGYQATTSTGTTTTGTAVTTSAVTSTLTATQLASNSTDPLCGTVFQNGLDLFKEAPANSTYGDSEERLFSMPSDATVTICVSFNGLMPANSANSPAADNFPGEIASPNITYVTGGYYVDSDKPAAGITDVAQSHLLTIGNATYPVIAYTITSPSGLTGVYNLLYSYQCPPWIPITVGYTTAQGQAAIAENYHVFLESTGCIEKAGQPNGIIVGVGGNMDIDWVLSG